MSRFSKTEAVKRGWRFTHHKVEEVVDLGDGITRTIPASLVAEKGPVNGQVLHEEGETLGKLLERIHAYETRL